ncbi:MAG: efflux RND transporter permease subunit, partial [Bacillota bacterium]|nr:efflux RND transporter permease subunit [Bacillota bacterium]
MKFFTKFSLRNVGLIFIAIALIFGGGLYALSNMKLEQYPNVDVPYLSLNVVYPGATPSQVSEDVGKPLEDELSKLSGLNNLYVISSANNANVIMEFSMTAKMDKAEADVNEAIAKVKFPETAQASAVQKQGPTSQPIYLFAVDGHGDKLDNVQSFIEDKIKPKLANVPDIADVDINGITDKIVNIKIDPEKLKTHNLTMDKVKQAIQASNMTAPTGEVTIDDKVMAVQVGKQLASLDEIKNISIMNVEQNTKGMEDAFSSIGDGFKQMGGSIGSLGKSVGMTAKQSQLLQQEILLTSGINQLAGQLQADQMKMQALMSNPAAAQEAQALKMKMQAEQKKFVELQGMLKQLQAGINKIGKMNEDNLASLGKGSSGTKVKSSSSKNTQPGATITAVKLSDIATVAYEAAGNQANITRLNGHPALVVAIHPNIGSNIVEIVKNVKAQLNDVALPKGYEISTLR